MTNVARDQHRRLDREHTESMAVTVATMGRPTLPVPATGGRTP
jgi:hypothetical protein